MPESSVQLNHDGPVLKVTDLKFSYSAEPLLDIAEFQVQRKEKVAVIGPSGCGKTTFMHLVAGLIRPDQGSIQLHGQEVTHLKEWEVDRLRGREIGIVFQRLHLMPSISVMNNLLLAQKLARVDQNKNKAIHLLEQLGIDEFRDVLPGNLSQGQAQRAAIARAVVHEPTLVIGDEPTSALDGPNAAEAIKLLADLSQDVGFGLLIVTHDERVRRSMDRVLTMGDAA